MNRFLKIVFASLALSALSSLQAKIIRVADEAAYNEALKNNQRLIVEFSADWCSVCNNVKKPFEEIANEDEFGNVAFIQVDVDKLDSISKQNGVVGVPTFVYLEKGDKKVEEIGVQNLPAFKDHLRDNLRKTFKVVQNTPVDITGGNRSTTMADITSQDVVVDSDTQAASAEPNFFARLINAIVSFFMFIIEKIREFFVTIVNAIKGFFGK
jgi:thioredoxin 1